MTECSRTSDAGWERAAFPGATIVRAVRGVRQAVAWFGLFLLLTTDLAAQERFVTIQNLSPYSRREWFTVSVPFPEGQVVGVPDMHVEDRPTVWQPFGALWPDGSLRQAMCLFPAELGPNQEARLELRDGPGLELGELPWPAAPAELEIRVRVKGKMHTARPAFVEMLEQNAARRVRLLRCRVGASGLVFEVIVEEYAGQEHAWIDLALFFSDPTTKAMQVKVERAVVVSTGAAIIIRHQGLLGVRTQFEETGSRVVLLQNTKLGDAQGIRRSGMLGPAPRGDGGIHDRTLKAAATCPPLGATDWTGTGAWGPFGYVPEAPPWLRGAALRSALKGRHARFVKSSRTRGGGNPFRNFQFGLAKEASQTGDQEDFGVAKLEPVAGSGIPSFLLEVEPSVLQEGCRPVHNFEADGSPVLSRNHPEWVVWSGRTHWHCDMSKDRLGKPCPEPAFEKHGWSGKDRQHWSSLYLTGYYLLTGKHWALREIQNEVQIYLAAQTVDKKFITSGPGAPRSAGRVLLTACWLYQCTGDQALLARMHERINKIYWRNWAGRKFDDDKVRTYQVHPTDARMLGGKFRYWTPWQDALAAVGFEAFHRMTGNPRAGALAAGVALNMVRHGWKTPKRGAPIIATAIRWQEGGEPLTLEQLRSGDKTLVLWSYGTAFSTWAIGGVEIARRAAKVVGDQATLQRCENLLRYLRSTRRAPNDRWFDRFGQWDGVRYDGEPPPAPPQAPAGNQGRNQRANDQPKNRVRKQPAGNPAKKQAQDASAPAGRKKKGPRRRRKKPK